MRATASELWTVEKFHLNTFFGIIADDENGCNCTCFLDEWPCRACFMRIITWWFLFFCWIWQFGRTYPDCWYNSSHVAIATNNHVRISPTPRVQQLLCTLNTDSSPWIIRITACGQVGSDASLVVCKLYDPIETANQQSNQYPSCIFDFRVDLNSRLSICPHRLASITTPLWPAHGPVISERLIGLVDVGRGSFWMAPWTVLFVQVGSSWFFAYLSPHLRYSV